MISKFQCIVVFVLGWTGLAHAQHDLSQRPRLEENFQLDSAQVKAKKIKTCNSITCYISDAGDTTCFLADYFRFDTAGRMVARDIRRSHRNSEVKRNVYDSASGYLLSTIVSDGITPEFLPVEQAAQQKKLNRDSIIGLSKENHREEFRNGRKTRIIHHYTWKEGADESVFTFDQNDSLLSCVKYSNGVVVAKQTYHSNGKLFTDTSFKTNSMEVAQYDAYGNMTRKTSIKNGKVHWLSTVEYVYDDAGRILEETVRDSNAQILKKTVTTYNQDGKRTSYSTTDGQGMILNASEYSKSVDADFTMVTSVQIYYSAVSQLHTYTESSTTINKDTSLTTTVRRTYNKDKAGQITKDLTTTTVTSVLKNKQGRVIETLTTIDGKEDERIVTEYDQKGRVIKITETDDEYPRIVLYSYHPNDQVSEVQVNQGGSFFTTRYDQNGKQVSSAVGGAENMEQKKIVNVFDANGLKIREEEILYGKCVGYTEYFYTYH